MKARVITIDSREDVEVNGVRISGAFFGPEGFGVTRFPGRWFQVERRFPEGSIQIRSVSDILSSLFNAWAAYSAAPARAAWPCAENAVLEGGKAVPPPMPDSANLGLATTGELLDELLARARVDGSIDYRTVGP